MGCHQYDEASTYKITCSGSTVFYKYHDNLDCSGKEKIVFEQTLDTCGDDDDDDYWEGDDYWDGDDYWKWDDYLSGDDMSSNSTDDTVIIIADDAPKRPSNPTQGRPSKTSKQKVSNKKRSKMIGQVDDTHDLTGAGLDDDDYNDDGNDYYYTGFGYCVNGDPDVVVASLGNGILEK